MSEAYGSAAVLLDLLRCTIHMQFSGSAESLALDRGCVKESP